MATNELLAAWAWEWQPPQVDDPMADKPAEAPKASGMMCPCCKNMAMMGGMKQDQPKAEPKHDMPMPK